MRVLLRSSRTRRYYIGLNQSSAQHEGALDFGNVARATKFTLEEKLAGMEIILRYDSCDGQISLPVLAEWCLFDERALRPATGAAPLALPRSLLASAHSS
jgi:hypothetical protein